MKPLPQEDDVWSTTTHHPLAGILFLTEDPLRILIPGGILVPAEPCTFSTVVHSVNIMLHSINMDMLIHPRGSVHRPKGEQDEWIRMGLVMGT